MVELYRRLRPERERRAQVAPDAGSSRGADHPAGGFADGQGGAEQVALRGGGGGDARGLLPGPLRVPVERVHTPAPAVDQWVADEQPVALHRESGPERRARAPGGRCQPLRLRPGVPRAGKDQDASAVPAGSADVEVIVRHNERAAEAGLIRQVRRRDPGGLAPGIGSRPAEDPHTARADERRADEEQVRTESGNDGRRRHGAQPHGAGGRPVPGCRPVALVDVDRDGLCVLPHRGGESVSRRDRARGRLQDLEDPVHLERCVGIRRARVRVQEHAPRRRPRSVVAAPPVVERPAAIRVGGGRDHGIAVRRERSTEPFAYRASGGRPEAPRQRPRSAVVAEDHEVRRAARRRGLERDDVAADHADPGAHPILRCRGRRRRRGAGHERYEDGHRRSRREVSRRCAGRAAHPAATARSGEPRGAGNGAGHRRCSFRCA